MIRTSINGFTLGKMFFVFIFLFQSMPSFSQQIFSSVTSQMGINEPGASYGQAVSWCDFDLDGDLDQAFSYSHGGTFRIYRNDGNQFTNITSASGLSGISAPILIWAAVNNDHYPDLIAGDHLYTNNQDGTFTNQTSGSGLVGYIAATGDFDQDGNLDLVSFNGALTVLWGDGNGHFTAQTYGGSSLMTAVCFDYDTDGDLDIYAGTYSGNNNILLRNNGNRDFSDQTIASGVNCTLATYGATTGDYNNDGFPDLYIGNHRGQLSAADNRLYHNNGDGTFSNVSDISGTPGQPSTRTCAFADFNNDGWLDLLVNDHYHGNHVYRNNTDGTFTEVAANLGLTGGFGDYFGLGWGDFDNDGALDLFVAGHFHIYRLYRNENCPHHWLKVRLQGTVDNTDAVGARLDLWAGELHTTRWVTAGEGASDFHSLEVEFGLGTAAFADSLKIVWPGGMQQTLVEVNGDMVLTVVQPESISSVDEIPENISGVKMSIHPNPFNPRTTVLFELSALGKISVEVFDVAGRRVAVLKDGVFEAGNYRINWDGLGSDGMAVASGVYYCRLRTEMGVAQEGMVLVR